ncbi:MAG: fumarylacetoacetase, partial [Blastocatellia bacterium]|nr:fumarylacetoacetase [Blastocatellia bacterium]
MYEINETHDPNLKSWVESANDPNTDFPIQNLPFCVFRRRESNERFRIGIRIGDQLVDIRETFRAALFSEDALEIPLLTAFDEELSLSGLMVGRPYLKQRQFRESVGRLLSIDVSADERTRFERCLIPANECQFG